MPTTLGVDYLPLQLEHRIHRSKFSSQVEILPVPWYYSESLEEMDMTPESETLPEPSLTPLPRLFKPPVRITRRENWWDLIKAVYAFNNPRIRSRLEKLMGSNIVRITDRKYMIKLQEKIKEDHLENQKKRIQDREAEEVEREKKLILEGKIPIEEAPKELKNHPVCKINQITKKILEDKRAKMKQGNKTTAYKTSAKRTRDAERVERETSPERDDEGSEETSQPGSGTGGGVVVCLQEGAEPVDDIIGGFMFCKDEYEKLKYEAPLVKMLKAVENVDEMYILADEIVGPLKNEKLGK